MNYPQIKPTLNLDFSNTKTLDPRINFRRGTPGAYYDGKTYAKAEENLVYPSIPDSNWTANEYSITTNSAIAPDGTTTASKIVLNNGITGSYNIEKLANVSINTFYTFSIYAKGEEFSIFNFDTQDSYFAQVNVVVDLSTGSIIEKGVDVIDSSITDVGNGWYRIVMTGVAIATGSNKFVIRNFEDTGDGSSGFYLWGAQLEQRDSVTSYTKTDGTPITKYQPQLMFASPDQPRFDHDPITGESKGLLIEESRTNRFKNSIPGTVWSTVNVGSVTKNTSTANYSIAPDGTNTATRWQWNIGSTTSDRSILRQTTDSLAAGTIVTLSIYLKSNTGSNQLVALHADGSIYSESVVTVTTEWQRFRYTYTAAGGAKNNGVEVKGGDSSSPHGSQLTEQGDILIWGAQLEAGAFPTSYIKTSGASATRSADNASITGENFSSWYRQDEGSIYVDSTKGNLGTSFAGYFSLHTEDFSNSEYYWLLHNSSDQFQFLVAPAIASLTDGVDVSLGSQKACVSWADDDFSMSVNGGAIQSDTSGPAKKNLAGLRIGFSPYSNSHYLNSTIKKLSYYPQRLTNEQLQQLTK